VLAGLGWRGLLKSEQIEGFSELGFRDGAEDESSEAEKEGFRVDELERK
jgi:hypothetical protein